MSSSGLLFTDISDHLPIFGFFCDQFFEINRDTSITFHDKSASNILQFQTLLENHNWSNILEQNNPNYAYLRFHANFMHIPGVPKKTIHCLISSNVKPIKAISIK